LERTPFLGRWTIAQKHPHRKGDLMAAPKLNQTEARQGTGPRGMFWVLIISIAFAVIAGLVLGLGWISVPWGSATP
jgi:hypothetical protein